MPMAGPQVGGWRRALTISLVALAVILAVSALVLAGLNGSYTKDPGILLSITMVSTYTAVGALLTVKLPRNPIGWLFLAAGLGLLLGGMLSEYAIHAFVTSPGTWPFGTAAVWSQNWAFGFVGAIPLIIVLFPTGRVPSPGWRWLPWTIAVAVAGIVIAAMFRPTTIEVNLGPSIPNPVGIAALDAPLTALNWVAGLTLLGAALASLVALVMRYRRSRGVERQQLRWFVTMAELTGVCLVSVALTSIPGAEVPFANGIAFFAFAVCLGIGIPVSCAVAVLRFHLWDLDVVVKKTLVFAIVVIVLMVVAYLAAFAVTTIITGQIADNPTAVLLAGVGLGLLAVPLYRRSQRIADRFVYGGRAKPYEVLADFSDRLGDAYSTDDVLPRMANVLRASTGAVEVRVWLRRANLVVEGARSPADTPALNDVAMLGDELPPFGDGVDVERIVHQGELLGAVTFRMAANDPMDPSKQRLVASLVSQAGLALRNVALVDDLRTSRRRIVAAQDERAKKLERDIHDGAQQQLVALTVKQRLLAGFIGKDDERARALAEQLQADTTDALETMRDLARGIYPPLLADKGLPAALEAQARKAAIPVAVSANDIGRFSPEVESAVYFSCLEALQNVAKYAEATTATIELFNGSGELRFSVTDDGRGFDPAVTGYGTGLQGIADRLAAIGGELAITSSPGTGTTVAGTVRVEATT